MRPGLTIGEFSQLTHLSVRTLRRYHEGGLVEPTTIDPHSGYRYYTSAQIPTAQVIHRLRDLGMPLREVADMLATSDPDARASMITDHLERLETELDRTRQAVSSLRRLLQPPPAEFAVQLRSEPAYTVAAIEHTVELSEVPDWYGAAMTELDTALAGRESPGAAGGIYANELFTDGRGSVLVYRPAADPPTTGRVQAFTVPAAELAVTVHHGDHSDIDVTYGQLGAFVADHALAVDGPVRERYLVGPRDTADAGAWRTEIGWPIFRVSPAEPR